MKFRIEIKPNGRSHWPWTWLLYVDGEPMHVMLGVSRSERKAQKDAEKAARVYAPSRTYEYEVEI